MTTLDVPRYLQRLQLDAPPPLTLAGLTSAYRSLKGALV